ncbi:hypothetical protein BATMR_28320 [Bacillus altitudinis]|nr:hypothetical protein US8_03700 [Bacillus altitudinis]GJI59804.1 hypothetical protein BATMR_28320 [Bacillus altitudinis]
MNDSSSYLKKLEDFLDGTFHQDIDSPEEALDEFIHLSYKKTFNEPSILFPCFF